MEIRFELIKIELVTSAQMEIGSELIELRLIASTQMRFYVESTVFSLLTIKSVHFRSNDSLSKLGMIPLFLLIISNFSIFLFLELCYAIFC